MAWVYSGNQSTIFNRCEFNMRNPYKTQLASLGLPYKTILGESSTKTVKGISEELQKIGLVEDLYKMIEKKANEQIKNWFPTLDVEAIILEEKEVSGW